MREKVLPVSVALDKDGQPTAPLAKKLAALGFPDFPLDDLERAQDGKAEAFFLRYAAPGATLADGLQAALDETLAKLPIPKVMTYQRPTAPTCSSCVRCMRLIALHGHKVVPVTRARHRFRRHHARSSLHVAMGSCRSRTPTTTPTRCARRASRRASSTTARNPSARNCWRSHGDDRVVMPEALLDEVNALVEWPVVYACHFERANSCKCRRNA